MLSHLRFHRRGGAGSSTPSSPAEGGAGVTSDHHQIHDYQQIHDQADHQPTSPLSTTTYQPHSSSSQFAFDKIAAGPPLPSPGDGQTPSSAFSSLPPTLPPIARVASPEPTENIADPDPAPEPASCDPQQQRHVDDMSLPPDSRSAHQAQRSPYNNMDSGFIGGVALRNYRRDLQAQASSRRDNTDASATLGTQDHSSARQRPVPAPINTSTPARPPPQVVSQPYGYKPASSSFVAPTDLQNASSSSNPTGRRPAGTRLTTEPSALPSSSNHTEPQKTKKGLPFLKNPMSTLLMRRRNGQATPDLLPPPISIETDEPTYDPRIMGTRVHDFSAPRRQRHPAGSEVLPGSSRQGHPRQEELQPAVPLRTQDGSAPAHEQNLGIEPSEDTLIGLHDTSATSSGTDTGTGSLSHNADESTMPGPTFSQRMRLLPQRDGSHSSIKSQQTSSSRYSDASTAAPSRGTTSKRTVRSRNISLSSDVSAMSRLSRLPKHMKSTSSRFSFDMIGAAQEEKILEERHRQREAEKKVTGDIYPRDSRFDDFDEDAFDYDAMMDDDGLEERIPGVNADYDEEDDYYFEEENLDDPDNDQDNFAGFAFQRSNGNSPLPTSHSGTADTPQDADGFLTLPPKASPHLQESLLPPGPEQPHRQASPDALPAGLGIQGAGIQGPGGPSVDRSKKPADDEDLYFDDGMAADFAEDLARSPSIDGTPFDESIFDNNDTDQYGRPIAGAFAQAQSQRQDAQKGSIKRESDMTSRFSAQSEVTRSTAHTSFSTAGPPQQKNEATADSPKGLDTAPSSFAPEQGSMAAYQAALAAAAHKAAASGKFQWGSSGGPDDDVDQLNTTDEQLPRQPEDDEEGDEYDFKYENMDDFELDDDAIIAEANASALANDLDGWYGQEFGFYSAPMNQSHGLRDSGSSAGDGYLFSNGGFFGPKGMDGVNRTKSGRVVSQEPNLTPITERSEYSNRNSVMSMAMPPHGFGTPLQSPGLAQLAMMVDQGDEMSLSALLRLRSRAWGGSQASQASSKEGSPKSDRGDNPQAPWIASWGGHANGNNIPGRKGSLVSGASYESEAGSAAGSPTVTMAMSTSAPVGSEHGMKMAGANPGRLSASSQPEQLRTSNLPSADYGGDHGSNPASANPIMASPAEGRRSQDGISPSVSKRRSGAGHQHRNSADSISYMREEESGETRWVIERRRIDESGQVEMEREVVEGGRI